MTLLLNCVALVFMLVYGLAWGIMWSRFREYGALIPMALLVALGLFVWKKTEKYWDRTARERIKFMRGGQAEGLVAWLLDDLGDDWHVFNNLMPDKQGDIDHVVVGPGGIFCISTKSHRGLFECSISGLRRNGKKCDFADEAFSQTMRLRDCLKGPLTGDVPFVQAVLAVPHGYVDGGVARENVWVTYQEDLLERICPENAPKKLKADQIDRIARALEAMQPCPAGDPTPASSK